MIYRGSHWNWIIFGPAIMFLGSFSTSFFPPSPYPHPYLYPYFLSDVNLPSSSNLPTGPKPLVLTQLLTPLLYPLTFSQHYYRHPYRLTVTLPSKSSGWCFRCEGSLFFPHSHSDSRSNYMRTGKDHAKQYVSVVAMIIESAGLYSCFSILFLVPYALNHPIQQVFLQTLPQIEVSSLHTLILFFV